MSRGDWMLRFCSSVVRVGKSCRRLRFKYSELIPRVASMRYDSLLQGIEQG